MLKNKDAIEAALGVSITWHHGDDMKASKLCYSLSGVSIENETDRMQMAKFQAEWSKKYYDVTVPYLSRDLGRATV